MPGVRSVLTPVSGHVISGIASRARAAALATAQIWCGKTGTLADEPPESFHRAPPILVTDTSVALKAYLEENLANEAARVLDAGHGEETTLVAPSLILVEFRHTLDKRRR